MTLQSKVDPPPVQPPIGTPEPIAVYVTPQPTPATTPKSLAQAPKRRLLPPRKKEVIPPQSATPNPAIVQADPPPSLPAEEEPPMDMTAMINAARERRQRAEETAARENAEAAAASQGPSANDIAMANIRRSLQGKREGTGGVFQVVRKGTRTGTFIFRGWTPSARNTTQQTFEVDAGLNGDVERAIVRRMIALIRTYYTGDFNWESHRLGRVLVKSARVEDTAELEAFLMREFFEN